MSKLKSIGANCGGQRWADEQESYKKAWEICERGDWMLWIACRADVDIRILTRVRVEHAKLVEHLMKDERSINALRVAEKFADGEVTKEELMAAAFAAADAASDASFEAAAANDTYTDAAAGDAAYAADEAADADAADDAACAAYAAYAAADTAAAYVASYAAFAAADEVKTLKQCADICRKYIDFNDIEKYLETV